MRASIAVRDRQTSGLRIQDSAGGIPAAAFSLLCLTLLTCGSGCTNQEAAARGGGGGRPPALVKIGRIEQRGVTPTVVVVGSVVPVRTSVVASGADGLVESYFVEEGDFVTTGDVLSELRMKTTDLGIDGAKAVREERKREWEELLVGSRQEDKDEAAAKLKAAEAVMTNTAGKLVRARSLLERGAINRNEFDDIQEQAEAARQAYLAAQAIHQRIMAGPRQEQIDQAHARYQAQVTQVEYLEEEKKKRTTRAPFDGFVVREHTFRGQWLSKGDPVITLARMDEVDVVANVDQRDESLARLFDDARVHVAGVHPSEWTGKIVAVVPRSEWQSGSRGFPVKVRLKNSYVERKIVDEAGNEQVKTLPVLKEGMMAEVTFTGAPIEAVLVSKDALVRTSRGTQMFLFDPLLLPKWNVAVGGDVRGNVVAADEAEARKLAEARFKQADDEELSLEPAARPVWSVETIPSAGDEAEADVRSERGRKLLGYLEADSEDLARQQARRKFKLAGDVDVTLTPQTGTVRRIVVELGVSDGEMIQIFADGVKAGSYVITEGAERLQDYQEVQLARQPE